MRLQVRTYPYTLPKKVLADCPEHAQSLLFGSLLELGRRTPNGPECTPTSPLNTIRVGLFSGEVPSASWPYS